MLSHLVFDKFVRMLLEGYCDATPPADIALPTLFATVREAAFKVEAGTETSRVEAGAEAEASKVDGADPRRTSMAGLTLRMFSVWRTRLRVVHGSGVPDVEALRSISYAEWADAVHTMFWRMPHIDHLHLECVAVTIAYCNMLMGSRAMVHVQEMAPPKRFTPGRLDRGTVYAVMRATKTRELGRAFCRELLTWCAEQLTARSSRIAARQDGGIEDGNMPLPEDARFATEAERVNMYLLRLDLSDEEKE